MAGLPEVPWLQAIDFVIRSDRLEMDRQNAVLDITPVSLDDTDLDDLEAFLNALTGATADTRPMGRPAQVPSGLPVD